METVLGWSEVWTLLIPLTVWLFYQKQPRHLKPIVIYLWVALPINIICDIIADYYDELPRWLQYNPPFYNLHSLLRFACFSWFFIALNQRFYTKLNRLLLVLFAVIAILNFTFNDDFFHKEYLSGDMLSAEAYFLLIYCLLYYLSHLKDETEKFASGPDFWVVTGLCIYVVINFFVFLFYIPMAKQEDDLALNIWNVHNVAYILLSLFIAKAFYASARAYH